MARVQFVDDWGRVREVVHEREDCYWMICGRAPWSRTKETRSAVTCKDCLRVRAARKKAKRAQGTE